MNTQHRNQSDKMRQSSLSIHETTKSNTCQTINKNPNGAHEKLWMKENSVQMYGVSIEFYLLRLNVCRGFVCQNNMLDYGVTFIHSNLANKHAKKMLFFILLDFVCYIYSHCLQYQMICCILYAYLCVSSVLFPVKTTFFAL